MVCFITWPRLAQHLLCEHRPLQQQKHENVRGFYWDRICRWVHWGVLCGTRSPDYSHLITAVKSQDQPPNIGRSLESSEISRFFWRRYNWALFQYTDVGCNISFILNSLEFCQDENVMNRRQSKTVQTNTMCIWLLFRFCQKMQNYWNNLEVVTCTCKL